MIPIRFSGSRKFAISAPDVNTPGTPTSWRDCKHTRRRRASQPGRCQPKRLGCPSIFLAGSFTRLGVACAAGQAVFSTPKPPTLGTRKAIGSLSWSGATVMKARAWVWQSNEELDQVAALTTRYNGSAGTAGIQASPTRMGLKCLQVCEVSKGRKAGFAAAHCLQCAPAVRHVGCRHRDGVWQTLRIDRNVALGTRLGRKHPNGLPLAWARAPWVSSRFFLHLRDIKFPAFEITCRLVHIQF